MLAADESPRAVVACVGIIIPGYPSLISLIPLPRQGCEALLPPPPPTPPLPPVPTSAAGETADDPASGPDPSRLLCLPLLFPALLFALLTLPVPLFLDPSRLSESLPFPNTSSASESILVAGSPPSLMLRTTGLSCPFQLFEKLDVRLPCPVLNGESGIGYSATLPSPPPLLPPLPSPLRLLILPVPSPSLSPSGSSGTDDTALVGRDSIPERGRGLKNLPALLPALWGGGGV